MTRRVLVARADGLGDVILAGPAVRAVARRASVTMLCAPGGAPAAHALPGVASVVQMRLPWIDAAPEPIGPGDVQRCVDRLRDLELDEAIILTSFHQSPLPLALLLRSAGVARLSAISVDYPGALLDVRHQVDDDLHEVVRNLSLVRAAGYEPSPDDDGRLRLKIPAAIPVARPPSGYVVVHPGASVPARTWSADAFVAVVRALTGRGETVCVTGGWSERGLTAQVAAAGDVQVGAVHDLGGRLDFAALGRVIADADAIVVGNTGPAHIAAAVATPVVSLYPPTVPAKRWRPWRVPHVLLGDQAIGCAGCRARECPHAGHPCLAAVGVEDVVEAIGVLRRTGPLVVGARS